MRVFITGANGFIGGYVVAALLGAGHEVVAGVREPKKFCARFPSAEAVRINLITDHDAAAWSERLFGCDALINCAGVLHDSSLRAVHVDGPKAMFDGAIRAGVKKIVQISAISADEEAGTEYALTKKTADDYLRASKVDWTILRPSLVYAAGAYGGTALMRALAAFPFVIPVASGGTQPFQPIHVDDLARTILQTLDEKDFSRTTIEPVGPDTLSLREILLALRNWLGLRKALVLSIPAPLIRLMANVGGILDNGPLNPTTVKQMEYGNTGDPEAFARIVGWTPRSFTAALQQSPAQTQDLWHARLYFLGPLLKFALVILWMGSAIAGLVNGTNMAVSFLGSLGLPTAWASTLALATSMLDLVIAALVLSGWRIGLVCSLQIAVVMAYTAALTLAEPQLWLDPFGPLLKNIPILVAILCYAAIAKAR